MNKFLFLSFALLSISANAKDFMKVELSDGTTATYNVSKIEQMTFFQEEDEPQGGVTISGYIGSYSYVDLGLESGTLWATYNIGTTTPLEKGDYFAWGETETKSKYNKESYKFWDATTGKYSKYGSAYGITLDPEDDAATANWGKAWRMPTVEQWKELKESCTWEFVNDYNEYGVSGLVGTSKKSEGKTIFLPATGFANNDKVSGYCYYWSSSITSLNPDAMIYAGSMVFQANGCINGYCIRPVAVPSSEITETVSGKKGMYNYVDLGLKSGRLWATANIGATLATDYGAYFAWGETEIKEVYASDFSDYKWYDASTKEMAAYTSKGETLSLDDDAANVNCGGSWKMPSAADFKELIDGCTWTWIDDFNQSGVKGAYGISNSNGNIIFFPAAGRTIDSEAKGFGWVGYYWSSSLSKTDVTKASVFDLVSGKPTVWDVERCSGYSVRPVIK